MRGPDPELWAREGQGARVESEAGAEPSAGLLRVFVWTSSWSCFPGWGEGELFIIRPANALFELSASDLLAGPEGSLWAALAKRRVRDHQNLEMPEMRLGS